MYFLYLTFSKENIIYANQKKITTKLTVIPPLLSLVCYVTVRLCKIIVRQVGTKDYVVTFVKYRG